MRFIVRCLLGIMLLVLTGCAAGSKLGRGLDGLLTVRASETGVVQVETHDVRGQMYSAFQSRPQLFQQLPPNLGSGWRDVTHDPYIYVPSGQWGVQLRLQPHGYVAEMWYRYDEETGWIGSPIYQFNLRNYGDDGLHDLVTYVRYRNGAVDSTFYRVHNRRVQ